MRSYRISTSLRGDVFPLDLLSLLEEEQHAVISFRRTEAVNAAHRCNDQRSRAARTETASPKPQLVEFIVDRRFFFDVEVRCRNIGFGLVVVVVGNEILDRIVRERSS